MKNNTEIEAEIVVNLILLVFILIGLFLVIYPAIEYIKEFVIGQ